MSIFLPMMFLLVLISLSKGLELGFKGSANLSARSFKGIFEWLLTLVKVILMFFSFIVSMISCMRSGLWFFFHRFGDMISRLFSNVMVFWLSVTISNCELLGVVRMAVYTAMSSALEDEGL